MDEQTNETLILGAFRGETLYLCYGSFRSHSKCFARRVSKVISDRQGLCLQTI